MPEKQSLNLLALKNLVREALAEDIGSGDLTTSAIIPEAIQISGNVCVREDCVLSGLPVFVQVFEELEPSIKIEFNCQEGDHCRAHSIIGTVSGRARAILTGERIALNFLQRLSGISTLTHQFVSALGDTKTRIRDTRKTTPGLRFLEKYAVSMGGGINHRMGLYDQILIKDNHLFVIAAERIGGIQQIVKQCREKYPRVIIEIEADTLEQFNVALKAEVDIILLDNMSTSEMIEAIKIRNKSYSRILLEASGGIRLERVGELGKIGLDYLSIGAITHSPRSIDIALDLRENFKCE